ncbi:MAG TPA: nitronate monooxygenase, partial [Salinimicrobium sp.]|nr:nitronate monooxygenase [Salinimicrobium sp.]
ADGVQVGSRFVASNEASSHQKFKEYVVNSKEGDTVLTLKELAPVRLLKNKFYEEISLLYSKNPTKEELINLLGRARAKKGMFEGDLEEGELEIGQVSGLIHNIIPAADIVKEIIAEFEAAKGQIQNS